MGLINGSQSSAPVHGGQPASVAVGQHLEGHPLAFPGASGHQPLDNLKAVIADGRTHRHVLLGNQTRLLPGGASPLLRRQGTHPIAHALQGPAQIHRCGPGGIELVKSRCQRRITGILLQCQHQPVGTGHADERSAAHHHRADGLSRLSTGAEGEGSELMGELGLVDHPYRATTWFKPDGAPSLAINIHLMRCG